MQMIVAIFVLLISTQAIICGALTCTEGRSCSGKLDNRNYRAKGADRIAGAISDHIQAVLHPSGDVRSTVGRVPLHETFHPAKATAVANLRGSDEIAEAQILGTTSHNRVWVSSGIGWEVNVRLDLRSKERRVSSLDWAARWERMTECLSFPEPDNADMFDMDEMALEAFWDRVWACYLPYATGK